MKFFTIIFAFYIGILSMMPCGDQDSCMEMLGSSVQYLGETHNHENQDVEDICSPLCMCHCCGSTTIIAANNNSLIAVSYPSVNHFYEETHFSSFSNAIWQPPKIS